MKAQSRVRKSILNMASRLTWLALSVKEREQQEIENRESMGRIVRAENSENS